MSRQTRYLTAEELAELLRTTPEKVISLAEELGLFYLEAGELRGIPGLTRVEYAPGPDEARRN